MVYLYIKSILYQEVELLQSHFNFCIDCQGFSILLEKILMVYQSPRWISYGNRSWLKQMKLLDASFFLSLFFYLPFYFPSSLELPDNLLHRGYICFVMLSGVNPRFQSSEIAQFFIEAKREFQMVIFHSLSRDMGYYSMNRYGLIFEYDYEVPNDSQLQANFLHWTGFYFL